MKYFITGAFSSAFFLYGVALLYGISGSTWLAAHRARASRAAGSAALARPGRGAAARGLRLQGGERARSTCGCPTSTRARPPRSPPSCPPASRRPPSERSCASSSVPLARAGRAMAAGGGGAGHGDHDDGQPGGPGAVQPEADAGVLVDRPRRLPADRGGGRAGGGGGGRALLPGGLRRGEPGRVRGPGRPGQPRGARAAVAGRPGGAGRAAAGPGRGLDRLPHLADRRAGVRGLRGEVLPLQRRGLRRLRRRWRWWACS